MAQLHQARCEARHALWEEREEWTGIALDCSFFAPVLVIDLVMNFFTLSFLSHLLAAAAYRLL
jgi:hypothetical protein